MQRSSRRILPSLFAAALLVSACGDDEATSGSTAAGAVTTAAVDTAVAPETTAGSDTTVATEGPSNEDLAATAGTYADIVAANYAFVIASATQMHSAIDALVAASTEESLAW